VPRGIRGPTRETIVGGMLADRPSGRREKVCRFPELRRPPPRPNCNRPPRPLPREAGELLDNDHRRGETTTGHSHRPEHPPGTSSSTTQGVLMNRRHFLKHAAAISALALPGLRFWQGLRAAEPALKKDNKSLIILWMGGGPSHMDLWDLKPGSENGGEFKPISTSAPGVEISEILPETAKQMKHLSIIRSLVTNEGSHERGTVLLNTGRPPSPVVQFPAMGSVASSLLTPKDLALPGFIGVGGTAQRIGPGFLGMVFAPFTVQNPGQPPENIKSPGLGDQQTTMERLRRRQRLFYNVEDN